MRGKEAVVRRLALGAFFIVPLVLAFAIFFTAVAAKAVQQGSAPGPDSPAQQTSLTGWQQTALWLCPLH
ncbi:MAG: hypothetical protein EXR67_00745 [Dehalococcoidia bacterium]|nr:hypothetical protein [Dehalococcoidia bacterium]